MVKQETKKTNNFGKKKGRRQQLLAARLSRSSMKRSSEGPELEISPPSPIAGPLSSQPDSPLLPVSLPSTSGTPSTLTQPIEHDVVCSASKRKLAYSSEMCADEESTRLPSIITDLEMLKPLFTGLLCPNPKCRKPSLCLENNKSKNSGLAISLVVRCTNCGNELASTMTSPKCVGAQSVFDVHRRAVAAASATGMGYAGLCNFSEIMNITALHHKTFAAHTKTISDKTEGFSRDVLEKAVKTVKEAYPEQMSDIKISTSHSTAAGTSEATPRNRASGL